MTETMARYQVAPTIVESVIAKGDLSKLTPQERVSYYISTCNSLGLNPLTRPFEYIVLNGKLVLYATRSATDQLRDINGVSLSPPQIKFEDDLCIVTISATDKRGRTDSDVGVVSLNGLKGAERANAIMKAITKAKRRVTLSICGLGWADESEIESIPNATPVNVNLETGEIVESPPRPAMPAPSSDIPNNPQDLLKYVNQHVEVPYDNIPHLYNAIRKVLGDGWRGWPRPNDSEGWEVAATVAIQYAQSKLQSQNNGVQDVEL